MPALPSRHSYAASAPFDEPQHRRSSRYSIPTQRKPSTPRTTETIKYQTKPTNQSNQHTLNKQKNHFLLTLPKSNLQSSHSAAPRGVASALRGGFQRLVGTSGHSWRSPPSTGGRGEVLFGKSQAEKNGGAPFFFQQNYLIII